MGIVTVSATVKALLQLTFEERITHVIDCTIHVGENQTYETLEPSNAM